MPRFCLPLAILLCLSCAAGASVRISGPQVGSIAPDFKARNLLTGEKIALNSQRGKVVILTFWASWCAPCRRELPVLEKAQVVVGRDRLTIFAVSFQEYPEAMRGIKKLAAGWHINMIEDTWGLIAGRYAISGIPHLFIIGRDGTVLANRLGYGEGSLQELVDDINHALAGTGTPPAEPQPAGGPSDTT